MLLPQMFNKSLFNDFFTEPMFNVNTTNRMCTDIKEKRYYGSTKRSFYVGDQITKEDIQAKYD